MQPARLLLGTATAVVVAFAACGDDEPEIEPQRSEPMELTSAAFPEGDEIPEKYTCEGDDVSPPLAWSGSSGEEYVLTLTDPTANGFVHWVLFGIPGDTMEVAEGAVPDEATEGGNDFGRVGYGGPCPPEGDEPHRYIFTLYALDTPIGSDIGSSASLDDVLAAIEGNVIAQGELKALYGR